MKKIIPLFLFFCSLSYAQQSVSILVDVSGSMKKNDPENLRRPAVKLLTVILPRGIYGQVLSFSTTAKPLISMKHIDGNWRQQGLKQLRHIHSRGKYTNIGAVLVESMKHFPQDSDENIVLLLTDGKVDVAPPAVNELERKVIKKDILEQLKKAKVKVHAIALSDNADHELLKFLAQETGGIYKRARDANELESIFYHLFNASIATNELSIDEKQRFNVDESVHELTVIIKDWSGKLELIDPLNKNILESETKYYKVYKTNKFTLITVDNPAPGRWQIVGPEQGNRALIFSEINLKTNVIPNRVYPNQVLPITVNLFEGNKLIKEPGLLDKSKVYLRFNEDVIEIPRSKHEKNSFNVNYSLVDFKKKGLLEITLQSKTFERTKKKLIEFVDNPYEIKKKNDSLVFMFRDEVEYLSIVIDGRKMTIEPQSKKKYRLKLADIGCGKIISKIEFIDGKTKGKTSINQVLIKKCSKVIKYRSELPTIPNNLIIKKSIISKFKKSEINKVEKISATKKNKQFNGYSFTGAFFALIMVAFIAYKVMRYCKNGYIERIKRDVQ